MSNPIQRLGRWIQSSGLVFWMERAFFRPKSHSRGSKKPEKKDRRHRLGARGEQLAVDFLKRLGYRIIAQGHRKKLGEIDVIAVDGQCMVFVEVKTWRSNAEADPSMAVDQSKQDKITRTALVYLKRHGLLNQPARFDVITVVCAEEQGGEPKIRHYKSAFEAVGHGQMFR